MSTRSYTMESKVKLEEEDMNIRDKKKVTMVIVIIIAFAMIAPLLLNALYYI